MEGPEGVEVLLISSRRGKGHVFPKGGWERDEELREAALRETVEEAGVRGVLEVRAAQLGSFGEGRLSAPGTAQLLLAAAAPAISCGSACPHPCSPAAS